MNSFVNAMTVAGAILFALGPVTGNAWAGTVPLTEHGGQSAPPAAGGQGEFVVVIASDLAQATANQLQQGLVADGFTTAEARSGSDGNYRVIVGSLPSRDQAEQILDELRKSGYTPQGVDNPGASAASGAGDTVYRVEVAEFPSESEADSAQKTLAAEGFVNVDVVPENGQYLLMLGTFNRRQDAEALLSEVSGAGFALAEVVQRERLHGAGSASSADLSGLPANQQAATREVLAMVGKVERGEATADEIKQLRDQIQQLTQGQRNVLSQQENTRATEREKLQKIFPLYREFDHAMTAQDYDTAEQALEKVRQIDPSDIFLTGRTRALEQARSGSAGAVTSSGRPDPAVVQATINEARKLEGEGKPEQALAKYREVVAMDATNTEARGKIAELGNSTSASGAATAASDNAEAGGLMQNKNVLYGAIGLIALVIIGLFLKSRKSKSAPQSAAPATSFGSGLDTVDPLAGSNDSFSTGVDTSSPAEVSAGDAPEFASFGDMGEEPEEKPAPAPAPAPVDEVSDVVSLDDPDEAQSAPVVSPEPQDETISINMEDDEPTAPAAGEASAQTPAEGSSALDADLESLLKGTFPGAAAGAADESVLESATPGRGVEDLTTEEQSTAGTEPRLVFAQSFDDEADGGAPKDWRGEYDYASLTVQKLDEAGHTQALCFHKPEGTGSATYHLAFPEAKGRVTAEFDIRCDQKNKFLLGVYLEKDEDFKQSVHTIVHQLDANSPAALRIQGGPTPYDMGTWRHVRYEIDLHNGTVDGFVDNEQVASGAALANAPEYVNTLSIRDNLATTGTLLLDNIRISEA